MKKLTLLLLVLAASLKFGTFAGAQDVIDPTTLNGKIMAGYQGWFGAPGDGSGHGWIHWGIPNADGITVDMWPDQREYDDDELFETDFVYQDLSNAGLFSSYTRKTVVRHVKWMEDYGIDGVFVQRFISSALGRQAQRDTVLNNVRYGAEKHGRVFANMYDLSGGKPESFDEDVINDWKHLVDDLKIIESPNYLYHDGKPVLSLWGVHAGNSKDDLPVEKWASLVKWLTEDAPGKYQVTLKAGVSNSWKEDEKAWQDVYDAFEFISPWAVGRYRDNAGADRYRQQFFEADLEETASRDMQYIPVVFPGFSWANLYEGRELNQIPRNGGKFLWHQFYNAVDAGCNMIYVAMYDEVDEGTAIFKLAENKSQIPTTGKFVTLDMDGYRLPSDWYLRLTGEASKMLRKEIPKTTSIPIVPYPNNAEFVGQEVNTAMAPDEAQTVSLTFKNNGTSNWTKTEGFRLEFDSGAGTNVWGVNEVELETDETIIPGESKIFTFEINAPSTEGIYPFQWIMNQVGADVVGLPSNKGLIEVGSDIKFFDDCNALSGWDSSETLSLNTNDQKQGSACIEFIGGANSRIEFEKIFTNPVDTGLTEYDAVLQFWYYVSDAEQLKGNSTVGLGSGGVSEEDEFEWKLENLKTGWNLMNLNLNEAEKIGSPIIDGINWFRLHSSKDSEITTRIDAIQILDKNAGASKFSLKVNKGSGSGNYVDNAIIRITANTAPPGQDFIGWRVDSGEPLFEDSKAMSTSIKITGSNIEVSAEYKQFGTYLDDCDNLNDWASSGAISINSTDQKEGKGCIEFVGQGTDEFKKKFETPFNSGVTIEDGKLEFWYYTSNASVIGSNQIELGSAGNPDVMEFNWSFQPGDLQDGWNFVSLKFSDANVTDGVADLSAINFFRLYNFKSEDLITRIDAIEIVDPNAGEKRVLIVNSGRGDGNYYNGTKVNIKADEGPSGLFFDKWVVESGNPEIEEILAENTFLIVPDENVTIKATYKEAGKQTLTVNNGSGSGEYLAGKKVLLIASGAPAGKEFDKWIIETGTPSIVDVSARITRLTMSGNDAIVTATFKDISTAVEDVEKIDFNVNVFPNPASHVANIRFSTKESSVLNLVLYDMRGKVIDIYINNKHLHAGENELTIPVDHINSGTYIIKMQIGGKVTTKLLTVQ